MMEAKDWISGLVGVLLFCLGLLPILAARGIGPAWFNFSVPIKILTWVVAVGGFYLIINSFIEITNSNIVGWWSFFVAATITVVGVLQVLGKIAWVSGVIFNL